MALYLLLFLPLGFFLWAVLTYNRLVGLRRLVDEAWSGISVQLKRRNELIPNLVEVVQGYARHESGLLAQITRLRSDVLQGLNANAASQNLARADEALSQAVGQVWAVAEAYPDLKAGEHFLALQHSLVDVEDALQMSRRYYNGTVRNYKIKRESFPSLIIGRLFRFTDKEFFALGNAAEAMPPKVEM